MVFRRPLRLSLCLCVARADLNGGHYGRWRPPHLSRSFPGNASPLPDSGLVSTLCTVAGLSTATYLGQDHYWRAIASPTPAQITLASGGSSVFGAGRGGRDDPECVARGLSTGNARSCAG